MKVPRFLFALHSMFHDPQWLYRFTHSHPRIRWSRSNRKECSIDNKMNKNLESGRRRILEGITCLVSSVLPEKTGDHGGGDDRHHRTKILWWTIKYWMHFKLFVIVVAIMVQIGNKYQKTIWLQGKWFVWANFSRRSLSSATSSSDRRHTRSFPIHLGAERQGDRLTMRLE